MTDRPAIDPDHLHPIDPAHYRAGRRRPSAAHPRLLETHYADPRLFAEAKARDTSGARGRMHPPPILNRIVDVTEDPVWRADRTRGRSAVTPGA